MTETKVERLKIRDITEEIQMRVEMSSHAVMEYAELLKNKKACVLPPVKAVRTEGGWIYVWDGNHTIEAAKLNGQASVRAIVEPGTREDAALLAAGANHDHGLRRTREDLRNTLRILLENPTWAKRSSNWLAKQIRCSHTFVDRWREELSTCNVASERETADGRVMDTGNIGNGSGRPTDEQPLCTACQMRDAVDGSRCQDCIHGDRTADDHLPVVDDDSGDRDVLPHVAHNNGNCEWYTPDDYLDAARNVLGTIELDPASSDVAQQRVGAETYYTLDDDGLGQAWTGTVWMNPPYRAELVDEFVHKLCNHFDAGDVAQAVVLVNNATDTRWFQDASQFASAICFPRGRIKFLDPDGNPGAPLQGQAVLYFGDDVGGFTAEFSHFGFCTIGAASIAN